jgi:arylsulfatase A-like enzyme
MFRPEDMSLPSTLDDIEVPSWAREAQGDSSFGPGKPDREARLRKALALHCGEVKLIDDSVGRLLDGLERCGILDETVVVFTADHGDYLGEHGFNGKNQLYETAYRVPMLMCWPGPIPRETVIDNVLSTVDFRATVLGLMGVDPCGREQGRDGSPLLRGERAEWRDEAFLHHSSHERAGSSPTASSWPTSRTTRRFSSTARTPPIRSTTSSAILNTRSW